MYKGPEISTIKLKITLKLTLPEFAVLIACDSPGSYPGIPSGAQVEGKEFLEDGKVIAVFSMEYSKDLQEIVRAIQSLAKNLPIVHRMVCNGSIMIDVAKKLEAELKKV